MIELWKTFNKTMKSGRLNKVIKLVIYEKAKKNKDPICESIV